MEQGRMPGEAGKLTTPNRENYTGQMEEKKPLAVIEVSNYGTKVKLEDGSEWRVVYYELPTVLDRTPGETKVVVREGDGWPYPYKTFLMTALGGGVNAMKWAD